MSLRTRDGAIVSALGPVSTERDTEITTAAQLLGAWDDDEEPTQPNVSTLLRTSEPEPIGDVVGRVLAEAAKRGEP